MTSGAVTGGGHSATSVCWHHATDVPTRPSDGSSYSNLVAAHFACRIKNQICKRNLSFKSAPQRVKPVWIHWSAFGRGGCLGVLKEFMRYICKSWAKSTRFCQSPESRKVTLDSKLYLPSVEFGIKIHKSDEKCKIRGSGTSRTIELNDCGGRTMQQRWLKSRFWRLDSQSCLNSCWDWIYFPTERPEPCSYSIKKWI